MDKDTSFIPGSLEYQHREALDYYYIGRHAHYNAWTLTKALQNKKPPIFTLIYLVRGLIKDHKEQLF